MSVPRSCALVALLLAGWASRAGAQPLELDQSDLRKQAYISQPELRIELVEATPALTLVLPAEGRAEFRDGRVLRLPAGSKIKCVIRNAQPPVRQYSVGVRTFTRKKVLDANKAAAEWSAKGYSVRVIEAGKVFKTAGGTLLADTRVYWVVLGAFAGERDARALERRIQRDGRGAWTLMETLRRAAGDVEIRSATGEVLGTGPTPVRLKSPEPIEVANVQFGVGFWGRGHREHRRFPGELEVDATDKGMVTLFNAVRMQDYIRGVVPVEISVKAPLEAMKAQAVSARTEALAKLGIKHFGEPFDLCASQHCQEYGGLTRGNAATNAAVTATRGLTLMQNGRFVDAVYSANCGGHTEHNDKVWTSNPNPALRGILDAPKNGVPFSSPLTTRELERWLTTRPQTYCGDPRVGEPDKFRWRVKMSPARIKRAVNRQYRVGNIQNIRPQARGVSGRLRSVQIIGDRDRVTVRKELNIRRVFGGLKSAMFIVRISRDGNGAPTAFTFVGGGWGHGVGLCQNGAMGMAYDGFKYPAILAHYFTDTYLQRVYD